MPLATPLNDFSTTLAADHAAGSGTLALAPGSGAAIDAEIARQGAPPLSPSAPIKVTVARRATLVNGLIGPSTVRTIFTATGKAGDTLTGVSAAEGTADQDFRRNDPAGVLDTAGERLALIASVAAKADADDVVDLATDQTVAGSKTLAGDTIKPDGSTLVWTCSGGEQAPFHIYTGGTPFSGVVDNVLAIGYNTQGTGQVPSAPVWYNSFEGDYYNGTNHFVEYNLDYQNAGNTWRTRPRSVTVNRDTHEVGISFGADRLTWYSGDLQTTHMSLTSAAFATAGLTISVPVTASSTVSAGTSFLLGGQAFQVAAALGENDAIISGFNLRRDTSTHTYKAIEGAVVNALVYNGLGGGIDLYLSGTVAAGATITPKIGWVAGGGTRWTDPTVSPLKMTVSGSTKFEVDPTTGAVVFGGNLSGDGGIMMDAVAASGAARMRGTGFPAMFATSSDAGGSTVKIQAISNLYAYVGTETNHDCLLIAANSPVAACRYATGLFEVLGGLILPTLSDANAKAGSLFFGSDHLDGSGNAKLCRKNGSVVTVIG